MRLGGIYALERLAQDSPQRDQPTVVEILGAFVQEHSRQHDSPPPNQGMAEPPKQGMADEAAEKPDATAPGTGAEPRPATDVQAALSVLSRLPQQPNVSPGDLIGAQLAGAQLFGADLSGARLFEANLSGAQLGRANLSGARLFEADLSDAQLNGANLSGAQLNGANLSGAKLNGANLSGAALDRADLSGAALDRANLSGARLHGANLHPTQGLTQEQLDVTKGDRQTQLPDGLERPTNWMLVGSPLGELGGGDI